MEEYEQPVEMIVPLGKDLKTGEQSIYPSWVPNSKIRPKDGKSIINFLVDTRFDLKVSPLSGGIEFIVEDPPVTKEIVKVPLQGGEVFNDIRKWKLCSVHIGRDESGQFVGLSVWDMSSNSGLQYFQFQGDEETPYYMYSPPDYYNVEQEYLNLHKKTLKYAQKAARLNFCDSPTCCVIYGCIDCNIEIAGGGTVTKSECHKVTKCTNAMTRYDKILGEWAELKHNLWDRAQQIDGLKLNTFVGLECREFGKFITSKLEKNPKDREFLLSWAKSKAHGIPDPTFIDSWKLAEAKDELNTLAMNAAKKAENTWSKILDNRAKTPQQKEERALQKKENAEQYRLWAEMCLNLEIQGKNLKN